MKRKVRKENNGCFVFKICAVNDVNPKNEAVLSPHYDSKSIFSKMCISSHIVQPGFCLRLSIVPQLFREEL